MLKFTGKPRTDNRFLDDIHGKIGFWTDNGGFYHYSIGDNASLGTNYEEVLPKVKQYHDELGVPFGHWQFDSWFYPKDGKVSPGGGGGAVTNWTSLDSVFPSGMAAIQEKLGVPIVMHNRQWSPKSDYIHNLSFPWYSSEKASVPVDPPAFFDWFFKQQEGWGLGMYEQDWMCTEYDEVSAIQTNITMGDLWLYGMAEGAARSGRTVQYCMPYSHEILSAAALPAVTNARATDDYFHGVDQWSVGHTAMYYWALNILPFKDGFYSSSLPQVGGQTVGPETSPDRETIMAALSCAMVGPMDGIYLLNKTRVMATCNAAGVVLKPDRPVTATDEGFRRGDSARPVFATETNVRGWGAISYVFASHTGEIVPGDLDLKPSDDYLVYNWYSGELSSMANLTGQVELGYEGHAYVVVAPVVEGWAVVGEVDKYVTASEVRVVSIAPGKTGPVATLKGVKGESVRFCAAPAATLVLECQTVKFPGDGEQKVEFGSREVVV